MFELLKNVVDSADNIGVNVPATDTAIKTYNIPNNKFEQLFVGVEVLVTTAAGSTAQNLNIKVKTGATTRKTFIIKITAGANAVNSNYWVLFPANPSSALTVTIGAAAADANTQVALTGFFVAGVD